VLAKYVQTRLSTGPEIGNPYQLASFFFNGRGEEIEKTTSGMIRALLYQIFRHRLSLIHQVPLLKIYKDLKKNEKMGVEWPPDILQKLLLSLRDVNDGSTFYLVIDSLDEAKAGDTATQVTDLLKQLASWDGLCKFKIFLTSRPLTFRQKFLNSPYPRISLEERPDSQYVERDIGGYISNKVTSELRRFGENLGPIIEKIRDRSNGVFLWVNLVMKRLIEEGDYGLMIPQLEKIVEGVPEGGEMDEMYQNILSRLPQNRATDRSRMLQWVLYAERPLTLEEFRVAVTMNCNPGRYHSEDQLIEETKAGDFKLWIESYCGGLVEFTENNTVVQLIHQSAKDYLLKFTHVWFLPMTSETHNLVSAQSQLASTCLAYLSFDAFLEGPTEDISRFAASSKYGNRLRHYYFLKYAALYWSKHLNMSPESIESMCHQVCEFAKTTPKVLLSFQVSRFVRYRYFTGGELLHLVSELGHEAVVKLLLGKGANVDAADKDGRTPLSYAAESGHEAVVKLLLEKGANVDAADKYGRTPLLIAARIGHEVVVRLLLEKGDNVNAVDKDGRTPLSYAAGNGHEAVVKLLLEKQANVNAADEYGGTPLLYAAGSGREVVVKLLLEKGANMDAADKYGRTPLLIAARIGHEVVVRLLLEKGADVDVADEDGGTPLLFSAENGHEAVVKLLLEKNANVNAADKYGRTPLLSAASRGHEVVVRLLLEKNANVNAEDRDGGTPLSYAAANGHKTIVELLISVTYSISASP
jgi:ankyrin repeat protein